MKLATGACILLIALLVKSKFVDSHHCVRVVGVQLFALRGVFLRW